MTALEVPVAATPLHAGQLELFRVRPRRCITIDYARPGSGALADEDFELLARLARATTIRKSD